MKRALFGLLVIVGCASTAAPKQAPVKRRIYLGASWFNLRAGHLGMSMRDAKERDAELGPDAPPTPEFWDSSLAVETVAVWNALCQDCHGGKRAPETGADIPGPPPDWGSGKDMMFENERPLAEAYAVIRDGAKPKDGDEEMPAWGDKLANEQIWALLYYLGHLSHDRTSRVHLERL